MGDRKQDLYTLTFYNKYNIEEEEVKEIFGEVGRVQGFTYRNQRFFIRYSTKEDAEEALNRFRDQFQCDYARERGERREGGGGGGRPERSEAGRAKRIEPNDDGKEKEEADIKTQTGKMIPALVDSSVKPQERFLFIIGNLPQNFTQDDVYNLIAEMNPIHVGKIDTTRDLKLLFCPIHLDSIEKVQYLYQKLDLFVVGGHKLIAMEAAQLIQEAGLCEPTV